MEQSRKSSFRGSCGWDLDGSGQLSNPDRRPLWNQERSDLESKKFRGRSSEDSESFWFPAPSSPLKIDAWEHFVLWRSQFGERSWRNLKLGMGGVDHWGTKTYVRISHEGKGWRKRRYSPRTLVPGYCIRHCYFDFGYGLLSEDRHFLSAESDCRRWSSRWAPAQPREEPDVLGVTPVPLGRTREVFGSLISWCLAFLICKMKIIIVYPFCGCQDD